MPPVAERLRRAYPALPEQAGVGSIPANSDAQNVPSFRRWRFEVKLSPLYTTINLIELIYFKLGFQGEKLKRFSSTKHFHMTY